MDFDNLSPYFFTEDDSIAREDMRKLREEKLKIKK